MDFAFLVDHKVKIKEIDKIDKYLDLAREQKLKLLNMRVSVGKKDERDWYHPSHGIVMIS